MNRLFQETQANSMTGRFKQFMQNPMQSLMNSKLNIPQQYQNNPQDAVNYLIQSGQVNQNTLNQAIQMANKLGVKL